MNNFRKESNKNHVFGRSTAVLKRMLSRVVVTFLIICFNARCFALRSEMCTVMTRSQMTYVLTASQRQQLTSQGYNFSQDPYNGIYAIVANADSKFDNLTTH